jgi:hypothetical protein
MDDHSKTVCETASEGFLIYCKDGYKLSDCENCGEFVNKLRAELADAIRPRNAAEKVSAYWNEQMSNSLLDTKNLIEKLLDAQETAHDMAILLMPYVDSGELRLFSKTLDQYKKALTYTARKDGE